VRHAAADRLAALCGVLMCAVLLVPAAAVRVLDAVGGGEHDYAVPARAMLAVLLPYSGVVLLALAVYAGLGWRLKYLASAVILGPFTLARPLVAVAAAGCGWWRADGTSVVVVIALGTAAVLAVEPVCGAWWYERTGPPAASVAP
jgi:hypothetical protein